MKLYRGRVTDITVDEPGHNWTDEDGEPVDPKAWPI